VVLVQAEIGSEAVESRTPPLPAELKILHIFDHSVPMHSGYAFRSIALLREQRRRGWHTMHITTPKHTQDGPSPEAIDGYAFHRTPAAAFGAGIPMLREIALIHRVAQHIERRVAAERPDLIHAHSPLLNALAAQRAGRRLGLPVVYEVRAFWEDAAASHGTMREGGALYRLSHALETHALRKVDAVTTICEGLRRDMLARGIAADRITVIPNGVDIGEFRFGAEPAPELRASLGLDGLIVLGFLGSYYSYEGLDLLLAALPLIRREQPNIVALLVGGGPEEEALKQQARRLGIEDAVRFVGRVPHGMIQRYYDLVDIFVYPRHAMRLTETTTPLKPLEAMARGGIVLASDVGGHRELVRDGETGYLFKAGSVEAFTRLIGQLIARKDGWPEVARKARQFVERERSWTATTAGYTEAYARALRARP
jgi:PEP-CTERM/exosortase A-associated glycosyltransferase